jgi:DNA-nicking Smr family endonuclease
MAREDIKDEERKIWRHFTRDVTPLRPEPVDIRESGERIFSPHKQRDGEGASSQNHLSQQTSSDNNQPSTHRDHLSNGLSALAKGAHKDVDARTLRRFRRGKMPIDGMLDLHGMGKLQASHYFMSYMQQAQKHGKRVILVITGHGLARPSAPKGILREALQDWVNWPENRSKIITFDQAPAHLGGQGAYLILLRRPR